MKQYVNTRSITKDYRYLGEKPDNVWLGTYTELTSFEHPTIIFEKEYETFRLFLSGMPSTRKDKVGTNIRYSFLFTGNTDEYTKLSGLVYSWVTAIDDPSHIAQKLGELYDESAVGQMIESSTFDDTAQKQLNDWLGSFDKSDHAFTQKISEVIKDDMGAVCYLNFIEDEKDVVELDKNTHVWLDQSNNFITYTPQPTQSQKSTIVPQPTVSTPLQGNQQAEGENGMGKSPNTKMMAMIAVIVVIAVVIAVVIL